MEKRLVPLNALIALLNGYGGWPKAFERDDLELKWLEVPVTTRAGLVTVDVLAYSAKLNLLVPAEVKSGANADEDQARKYGTMTAEEVLRLATVHGARARQTRIEPLYVILREHRNRITKGLRRAGLSCPLLLVGSDEAVLLSRADHSLSAFKLKLPSPPPPIIPLDSESPEERYLELSISQIVARAASGDTSVSLDAILEAVNPYWTLTHDAVRGAVRTKAKNALKRAFDREFKNNFALDTTSSGHAIIRILRTPADYDPRGRSQGWQAMAKRAERALRRRPRAKVIPGQASFEDLGREAEAGER